MQPIVKSYLRDAWVEGSGDGLELLNPTNEDVLARAVTSGLDLAAGLDYARQNGVPALAELSFAQRGQLLKAMSKLIHENRDALIDVARTNGGNTRSDAKFDIDGGSFTLSHYARIGAALGSGRVLSDGDLGQMARHPRYVGGHLWLPRGGVAVHINAFNFPVWGFAEKAAQAILAGMPIFCKPAPATCLLTETLFQTLVQSAVVPDGVISLLSGEPHDLLDHLGPLDALSFTGSSAVGAIVRGHPNVVRGNIPVTVEADSVNAAVLGPDVEPDSPTFDMFVREVAKEIRQKTGQKCTAIRRILVPRALLELTTDALTGELKGIAVGDPALREVKMGPLVTPAHLERVQNGCARLAEHGRLVCGGGRGNLIGIDHDRGAFIAPTLYQVDADNDVVHQNEVFGPVSSLLAYSGDATRAAELVRRGGGGLVSSIYSDDKKFQADMLLGIGPHHGRLYFGSKKISAHAPGSGTVLPGLNHGGPGRAGGGAELGGVTGLHFYMQRTAIQGDKPLMERLLEL